MDCIPVVGVQLIVLGYVGPGPAELLMRAGALEVSLGTFFAWESSVKGERGEAGRPCPALVPFLRDLAEAGDAAGLKALMAVRYVCGPYVWVKVYKTAIRLAARAEAGGRPAGFGAICQQIVEHLRTDVDRKGSVAAYAIYAACAAGWPAELRRMIGLVSAEASPETWARIREGAMAQVLLHNGSLECLGILRGAGFALGQAAWAAALKGRTAALRLVLGWGGSPYVAMHGAVASNRVELVSSLEPSTRDPDLELSGYWAELASPANLESFRALERAGRFRQPRERVALISRALRCGNAVLVRESLRALRGHPDGAAALGAGDPWFEAAAAAIARGHWEALEAAAEDPSLAAWLRARGGDLVEAGVGRALQTLYGEEPASARASATLATLQKLGIRPAWKTVWALAVDGPTQPFLWARREAPGAPAPPPGLLAAAFRGRAGPAHLAAVLEAAFPAAGRAKAVQDCLGAVMEDPDLWEPRGVRVLAHVEGLKARLEEFVALVPDVSGVRVGLDFGEPPAPARVYRELGLALLSRGAAPGPAPVCPRPGSADCGDCGVAAAFRALRAGLGRSRPEGLSRLVCGLPVGLGRGCRAARAESAGLLLEARPAPRKRKRAPGRAWPGPL